MFIEMFIRVNINDFQKYIKCCMSFYLPFIEQYESKFDILLYNQYFVVIVSRGLHIS